MTQRMNFYGVSPKPIEALAKIATVEELEAMGLGRRLQELVKTRASQINGCANCLHMHTADALKAGEIVERLLLLDAWRESRMYTPRERAALAWTEALTKLYETGAPDADYEGLKAHFNDQEIVGLTLLIGMINTWNRLAVGFRAENPSDRRLAADREAAAA